MVIRSLITSFIERPSKHVLDDSTCVAWLSSLTMTSEHVLDDSTCVATCHLHFESPSLQRYGCTHRGSHGFHCLLIPSLNMFISSIILFFLLFFPIYSIYTYIYYCNYYQAVIRRRIEYTSTVLSTIIMALPFLRKSPSHAYSYTRVLYIITLVNGDIREIESWRDSCASANHCWPKHPTSHYTTHLAPTRWIGCQLTS